MSKKAYHYDYDRTIKPHHWHQKNMLWLAKILLIAKFGTYEYHGVENVPRDRQFILCANHVDGLDPINLINGCGSPREAWFMAKKEHFDVKPIRYALYFFNGFPVDRSRADLTSIRFALKVCRRGYMFVIFPEGTRDKTRHRPKLENGKSGAAFFSRECKLPVVPASIHLDPDLSNKHPASVVRFGKPIEYEEFGFTEGKRSRKELQNATDLIMTRIQELWDQDTERFAQ